MHRKHTTAEDGVKSRSVSHSGKTPWYLSIRPVAVLASAFAAALTTGLVAGPFAGGVSGAATPHVLATSGLGYTPLTAPVRIADTRAGAVDPSTYAGKTLAAGGSLTVDVPAADVPATASAVVVNITAINPSNAGFLTVFPGGGTNPGTANVTYAKSQTVGNQVTVGLGSDAGTGSAQSFTVFNGPATGGGTADFTADLVGYYAPQTATSGAGYNGLTPTRIYDSRTGSGQTGAGTTLTNGGSANVTVTGVGGVPATATAVVLNVAVTNTTASSFITAFPTGQAQPGTASQNFLAGETLSSQVVAGVGTGGDVTIANHAGNADIIVDVDGYFTAAGGTGSLLTVLAAPVRLTDTRPTGVAGGASAAAVVQGTGATAGVLSVADITTPGDGNFLTAYPTGATAPLAATVNYTPGDTYNVVENAAYATTGTGGSVSVLNGPSNAATANVVVDEDGFFAPPVSNAIYTVTPGTTSVKTISTIASGTATDTQGDVNYTATGLGTTPVDIELFAPGNVTTANGQTTFAGTGSATPGAVTSFVSVVNGTIQGGTPALISNVTPIGGQVTFTVNSTTIGASIPVVFAKAAGNDLLGINSSGAPTQSFGVGGEGVWSAAAAPNGTFSSPITVIAVNPAAGTFEGSGTGGAFGAGATFTFNYNTPGSTYTYSAGTPGSPTAFNTTAANFGSYLSGASATGGLNGIAVAGDTLGQAVYNSAGPSTFNLTSDVAAPPSALTGVYNATATPLPGVVLNWTPAVNPDIASVTVEKAPVASGVVGTFAPIAAGTALAQGTTTFTDTSVNASPGSTFAYEVVSTTGGIDTPSAGQSTVSAPVQVTIPTTAFTALPSAPVSLSAVDLPATTSGDVSKGDIIDITFNQPLNTPTSSATVTLADIAGSNAGNVGTLVNGVNATFALTGTSNNQLAIILTNPPAFSTGAILSYPATIVAASGITGLPTSGGAGDLNWDLNTNTNSATPDGANPAFAEGTATVPGNTGAAGETENGPRALAAGSGSNVRLSTSVVGAAGSALPGATVTVSDSSIAGDTASAVANANGSWSVTLPTATATGNTVTANETILQEGIGETVPTALTIVPS